MKGTKPAPTPVRSQPAALRRDVLRPDGLNTVDIFSVVALLAVSAQLGVLVALHLVLWVGARPDVVER